MNTLILTLALIFGLSWIGSILFYGFHSVRSFIRKDKWEFEDDMKSLSTCIFIGWIIPFILLEALYQYIFDKITDKWD